MGWYHYECAENGSCDANKPAPCPDGTCPALPDADAEQQQQQELYTSGGPIYHLCQKKLWQEAVQNKQPYYPPTFWSDGRFTRASCALETLPNTGNHFYQHAPGDWLCLELDPVALGQLGIPISVHRAPEDSEMKESPIQCLKIHGGIPTTVPIKLVTDVYAMQRDESGRFFGMKQDSSVPQRALIEKKEAVAKDTNVRSIEGKAEKDVAPAVGEAAVERKEHATRRPFWKRRPKDAPS